MTPRPDNGRLCVLGSLNLDHIAQVEGFPRPGETVRADQFLIRHGGKGANQAVAAARQGARVDFIGALGADSPGCAYRLRLINEGIGIDHVGEVTEPTGSALITVDASGENTIVVVPGANGTVSPEQVGRARHLIEQADFLLTQLEVPVSAVVAAMRIANGCGCPVIFNPSPFDPAFPWNEVSIDILVVNESEAEALDATLEAGAVLPVETLVITHGSGPTELITPDGDRDFAPPQVDAVDTTGAGDTFAGSFAARLALGDSLEEAVIRANAAAAISTLSLGAQEAMPDAVAVESAVRFRPQ